MIDVSIIIVNYNVAGLLAACIDSIMDAPIALHPSEGDLPIVEIIVVDSASKDGSVSMLRERYPQVKLLAQPENVGFTRGNNIGLEAAQGRYLFLLNPDTEIIGDAINQMVAYLDQHPRVGMVGPQALNTDRSHQSTRRRFPTRALAFFESTWLQPYAPQTMLDAFYVHDQPDDGTYPVDWVQGCALMVRREIYEQIGGLDTGYVMYSEELDWCRRAADAGWQIVYIGSAKIVHHGGKSSEQIGAQKHIYFQESKLRYFRKFHGRGFASFLRAFLLLNYTWQIILEATKGLLGHKRALRRQRVQTYWQVLRSGLKVT